MNLNLAPDEIASKDKFKEVKIPVPWGHIAGKWYGSQNIRPLIGIHGWQDNAGTFDTLVPLLPSHIAFLAIDLPGHGLSSWIPNGFCYHSIDYIYILLLIMREYNWKKISILGHSLGSITGFIFSALYPEKVDLFIGIDVLKPPVKPIGQQIIETKFCIEKSLVADERNQIEIEPPSYLYDDLIDRFYNGYFGSVAKECCHYILDRNIKKSKKYPDKYYFCRDNRLKYYDLYKASQELCGEMANRIICPQLYIKAVGKNTTYYENKNNFDEIIDILQKRTNFEFYEIPGTHHLHLNEPENVCQVINPFICKYYVPEN